MDRYAFDDGHAFGSLRRAQTGIDWLPTGTKHKRYIDNVLIELCERHKDCGNSGHSGRGLLSCELSAATCAIFGSRLRYRRHQDIRLRDREDGRVSTASGSRPFRRATEIRQDRSREIGIGRFPVFSELREEGITDYVAWTLEHTRCEC